MVMHKAVIKVGNPSLEELDWAIEVIYPEMRALTFISSSVTRPKISLARSTIRSDVWEVGARLE